MKELGRAIERREPLTNNPLVQHVSGVSFVWCCLAGCTSSYQAAYEPVLDHSPDIVAARRVSRPPAVPALEYATALDATTIDAYAERGYFLTGRSSLSNSCSRLDSKALDQGKNVGADLVVIDHPEFGGLERPSIGSWFDCYLFQRQMPRRSIGYFDRYRVTLGAQFSNLSDREKEVAQVRNGVLIRLIVSGSPAEQSDLRVSDIVISVDGREIANVNLANRLLLRDRGMSVDFMVSRRGHLLHRIVRLNS